MACFTDLDYRNKSYPLLQTIQSASQFAIPIVSYGCYDAMSDSAKMYQFYAALIRSANGEPLSENCFLQKTEDQQWFFLNNGLNEALGGNFE